LGFLRQPSLRYRYLARTCTGVAWAGAGSPTSNGACGWFPALVQHFPGHKLRKDYGERRIICFGLLRGRLVVVGYTPRRTTRHGFSMRKANAREKARLAAYFEV